MRPYRHLPLGRLLIQLNFLIGQNQPTRPNATGGQLVDIIAKLTHDELICVFQINQLDQLNSNSTIVVTIATTIIVVGKFDPTTP